MSPPRYVPLPAQIMEVEYELTMRRQVYPGLVSRGKMKPAEADLHISQMEAVLRSLRFLEENEAGIRAYIAERKKHENEHDQAEAP